MACGKNSLLLINRIEMHISKMFTYPKSLRVKMQATEREYLFATHITYKGLVANVFSFIVRGKIP